MARDKPSKNPFYVALVLVGVAFLLTAFCYGLMAYREATGKPSEGSGSGLLVFLDQHGMWLLTGELVVLILASIAAIATDRFWTKSNGTAADVAASQGDGPSDKTVADASSQTLPGTAERSEP